MTNASAQSWSSFWQLGNGAICLPSSPDAHQRLARVWCEYASGLPSKAKIIDLACGSGVVSYALRRERPDISVVGVDFAQVGPSRVTGVQLVSGVTLDQLPFNDSSLDGAVSQFGIEYADRRRAVTELSRVLRPGSPITLVMHHAGSPVVKHNKRRARALGELTGTSIETAFLNGDRAALDRAFALLRSTFADQDVIPEFELGLGSAMVQPHGDRTELWRGLTGMVSREREILTALAGAAIADCQPWLDQLSDRFEMEQAAVISEANGLPLAWLLRGRRT